MLDSEAVWHVMEGAAPHTPFRLRFIPDIEGLVKLTELCGKNGVRPLLVIEEEERRRVEDALRNREWPAGSDRIVVIRTSHLFDLEVFTITMRPYLASIEKVEAKRYIPTGW